MPENVATSSIAALAPVTKQAMLREFQLERPETQFAHCGKLNIAYQVSGTGPIDMLHAPGWVSNLDYVWESPEYAAYASKLSRFCRLIRFDKRGTGLSDRDVGAPTLEQRTDDIRSVLDAVGSESAVLYGTSEGGTMATLFAATYPERVSHLVLSGCFARFAWAPDYPQGERKEDFEKRIRTMIENWGGSFPLDAIAPSVANDPAIKKWFASLLRYSASPGSAEQITRLNYSIDIRHILPAVRVPTLVLHREGDRRINVEHGRYLAEHIPGAELCILPGDDHAQWYGDQDGLIAEIQRFVTGQSNPTRPERALLTVVMIDIVNSTQTLSSMGDERWRSLLDQLDTLITMRIGGYEGQKVKHTGDGYLLSFTGPTRAIECARAINRDIASLGLECRIGIHTGECERRENDISGIAVHLAARIMDQAKARSILISQTVKDLVAGSGLDFKPLGMKKLKGLPDEWGLFEVVD